MRMGKAKAETTKSTGPVSEEERDEEISNFGQIISHSGIRDRTSGENSAAASRQVNKRASERTADRDRAD